MATQAGWIRVAAGPAVYRRSLGCGMCLEITGTGTGSGNNPIVGKRKAVIVDQCAAGCGNSKFFYKVYYLRYSPRSSFHNNNLLLSALPFKTSRCEGEVISSQ